MSRILTTLASVCLGTLLLAGTGCDDKVCQDSLKTCKNDLGQEQKTNATDMTTINGLKSQLAQSEAKVQELTKENETLKAPKGSKAGEEKMKAPESKKSEAGKKGAKGKK
jgi:hypothetical protein